MVSSQTPQSFLESLKLRARRLTDQGTIVAVEGHRDRKALLPLASDGAYIVPAGGREKLVFAFEELAEEFRDRVLFILDCDGGVEVRLKGRPGLVITSNRDMEADLVLELNAVEAVILQVANVCDIPNGRALSTHVVSQACDLSAAFGAVLAGAWACGYPTKIGGKGGRRPHTVTLLDIDDHWSSGALTKTSQELADRVAAVIPWDGEERGMVVDWMEAARGKACRRHGFVKCSSCWYRSYSRGHDLVDALGIVLTTLANVKIEALDELLRLGLDRSRVGDWSVARRVRSWEARAQRRALRPSIEGLS
jgi:hypothetical protein